MIIQWPFMSHNFYLFFLTKLQKIENKEKIILCVIAFDLIKILKCWASQNDGQILSFVKANNVVFKKMTRNSVKMSNS